MEIPYRIITISGLTCSGGTTQIRLLSKSIGWPHINPASVYVRQFLVERKLPLSAMAEVPDEDEIENESMTADVLVNQKQIIVGGRLSGWLAEKMPDVYRIFVTADLEIRIQRFATRENFTLEKARTELKKRESSELSKYQRIYNADLTSLSIYNCVIDTTSVSPQESLEQVLAAITR